MKHINDTMTTLQTSHKAWMIDIATIRMESGIRYLAVIMDRHTILGWSISKNANPKWIRQLLEDAIDVHGIPETIYTDRAAIFGTDEHVAYLAKCGISRIEGGKKKSTRTVERFFGRLRNSHLYPFPQGQQELEERVREYILDFNADINLSTEPEPGTNI